MLVADAAFYEIIQNTWTATLGFPVERCDSTEFSAIGAITACVRISGAWHREVRLHCPLPLARRIASAIFEGKEDKVERAEILDALSELIHIIGGNLKALLPQPVILSFPSVQGPTNCAQTTPRWKTVCRLTLMSEGHPFVASILGDVSAAAGAETTADRQSHTRVENR